MEIALVVSNGIDMICRCNFTSDYITDETFECDEVNPDLIIVNGRIISTNNRDSSDLVGDLEKWVSSGPTVVVQGKELRVVSSETPPDPSSDDDKVNSSGKEEEDSSDDDEVNSNGKEQGSNNDEEHKDINLSWTILGAVLPVIISLLLVSTIMIGTIILYGGSKSNDDKLLVIKTTTSKVQLHMHIIKLIIG